MRHSSGGKLRPESSAPTTPERTLRETLARANSPDGLVLLALGGNQGDTRAIFQRALGELRDTLGQLATASLYKSAPLSSIPQPDFLNTVAACRLDSLPSPLEPAQLLVLAKGLEKAAGRIPGPRFGPRPLDIDLLFFGRETRQCLRLTLPHPRLRERRFVLEPLADLTPDLRLPPDGRTPAELATALAEKQEIEQIPW